MWKDLSNDLTPYQGAIEPLSRDSRRAGREISRMEAGTQTRLARIDKETDATIAKGHSLTSATAFGMNDVTRIAKLQTELETIAPGASGRLNMLADFHAMGVAEELAEHQYRLRRL
jgi:hypothetical protein